MTDAFESGYELYRQEPDLMLIEVYHRAPSTWSRADQEAFLMGYIIMRRKRDEYESEARNDQGNESPDGADQGRDPAGGGDRPD